MADLKLNADGDLDITDGNLSLVTGDDAIVQQITIRLKLILGEWFLDNRVGLPVFEEIFVKNPDLTRVRSIYRQAVIGTPGVSSLEEFNLGIDNETRTLSVDFRARKTDGEILDYDNEFIIK
ncbi:hypothetical protein K0U83_05620 [bacterium]|nr:hypothetical protein [bacterium]